MKKIELTWLLLFLCLFTANVHGQELETEENDILGSGLLYEWCLWVRHEDGKTEYKQITNERTKTINVISYCELKGQLTKTYYCRYADNKLYRYIPADNSEYVAFDFSLNPGDIFSLKDGRKVRVEEVSDTIFKDTHEETYEYGPYKLLRVVNVDNEGEQDLWLEGFGSMTTAVFGKDELGADIIESHLLWTSEFPVINKYNTDYLKTQLMDVEKAGEDIDISPDMLCVDFENDTLVVAGEIYTGCAQNHYLSSDIQNNVIDFNVLGVNAATCTKMYGFSAHFPGFKDGQYTFRYHCWNGNVIEKKIICGKSLRRGDVNEDGVVDINDVVSVINVMAETN